MQNIEIQLPRSLPQAQRAEGRKRERRDCIV